MRLLSNHKLIVLAWCLALVGCRDNSLAGLQDSMKRIAGPSRAETVNQMFSSQDPDLRRQAICELSRHDWGRRDPYPKGYAALSEDPDPGVRAAAVRALGLVGDPAYLKCVLAAMKDSQPNVRWDAAVALDSIVGADAVAPLCHAAVSDATVDVRGSAAFALRHYRRKEALDALLRCLGDQEYTVRFKASQALTELTGEKGGTDAEAWQDILAKKPDPFSGAGTASRPWWDWLGATQKDTTTKPAGAVKPPTQEGQPGRPWWDWLGVTGKNEPTARPAEAAKPPTRQGRPERPWWDWLGVTQKDTTTKPASPSAAPPKPKAEEPTQAERPWWDWFGVTKKQ